MKKFLRIIGVLAGLVVILMVAVIALTPWMDRWGATEAEISAAFPGDELVPEPASFVNRAVTVQAAPEQIFPWLVQLGAKKGGLYSYDWFETNILRCQLDNSDWIHPEWQDLQVGDLVEMCPDQAMPPPYTVAQIVPDQAIVMGHQENGEWVDLWQFVLLPQPDGATRLVLRTRTMVTGVFWDIIHPGIFIMERGMLLGIRSRAEALAQQPSVEANAEPAGNAGSATPTPEVFNPLDPSPTPSSSDLPLSCQVTDLNVYIDRAAGFCFAYPLNFSLGDQPSDLPTVGGPLLDGGGEPVFASLEISYRILPEGSDLGSIVDEFLAQPDFQDLPWTIGRAPFSLGGEPAEQLEPVPGLLSSRVVMVLHRDRSIRLSFHPVDVELARPDLEALFQTVTGSFAFLP